MTTENVRLRLRGYLDDGLFEIALAAALVTLGSWFLLEELTYMAWIMPWLFMVVILPTSKKRVAGPRGGVVDMPRPQGARALLALLVLGLVVLAVFVFVVSTGTHRESAWFRPFSAALHWLADHFALALAVVFSLVLAKLGLRGMTPRLVWLAGLSLIVGILADLLIPSGRMGALVTGWAVGLPLWINGYVHHRRFISTHPSVEEPLP